VASPPKSRWIKSVVVVVVVVRRGRLRSSRAALFRFSTLDHRGSSVQNNCRQLLLCLLRAHHIKYILGPTSRSLPRRAALTDASTSSEQALNGLLSDLLAQQNLYYAAALCRHLSGGTGVPEERPSGDLDVEVRMVCCTASTSPLAVGGLSCTNCIPPVSYIWVNTWVSPSGRVAVVPRRSPMLSRSSRLSLGTCGER
jgi:hypothetical protein